MEYHKPNCVLAGLSYFHKHNNHDPKHLDGKFPFGIGDIFTFFDTDKAVTLVFDLGSIEETTNTEEAGFFCHVFTSTFHLFKYTWIERSNEPTVKFKL